MISPLSRLMRARMSCSWPYLRLPACWIACSIAWSTISRSIPFSRATMSATCKSSMRPAPASMFIAMAIPSLSSSGVRQELVGQHELRLRDRLEGKLDTALGQRKPHPPLCGAFEPAPEAPPPGDRLFHLDHRLEPRETLEVARLDERAIDAGRAHLERVGACDRLLDIEQRRERLARARAVLDAHRAFVDAFDHDLEGTPIAAGEAHPDATKAKAFERGFDQRLDAANQRRSLTHTPST